MAYSVDRESQSRVLVVGIDASRNRSGGARAHVKGILESFDPREVGIAQVHLWTFPALADAVPNRPWLVKHVPQSLTRSLPIQLLWQAQRLSLEAQSVGCDILFTTDASTLCRFSPMVVLSQDMLSYEPGVMATYGVSLARLRLETILRVQNAALRHADGVIFLSHHASRVIQGSCGTLSRFTHIPHGVGEEFFRVERRQPWPGPDGRPIQCLYVSNAALYKFQWIVIRAVAALRKSGHNLKLRLVGGGAGLAQRLIDLAIEECDPDRTFVEQLPFVPHRELPEYLASADIFVFASGCENLPVTLLEAMAAGLPIACSSRGPMPEVLGDAGVYFDPSSVDSVAGAIGQIVRNEELRVKIALASRRKARDYSWARTARETMSYIKMVAESCGSSHDRSDRID